MDIKLLAEREARAETSRRTAEESWRLAWWQTTMALGAIPRGELTEAFNVVGEITGQSRRWLSTRSLTGRAFREAGFHVTSLPPRMSIEVVRNRVPITDEVVAMLREAETEGTTLREFAEQLTGRAWADTAKGTSAERLKAQAQADPEAIAKAVHENPEAMRVLEEYVFREKASQHHREATPTKGLPGGSKDPLTELVLNTQRLRRTVEGQELTEYAQANLRWIIAELTSISEGGEFVGDIEQWLVEVSS